jgi:CRP-like cAMP-binding protein
MEETLKTPQAAAGLLANASFFGSLSAEDRETVALCMRTAVFSAGQVIFLRHDEARDLFVVRKGVCGFRSCRAKAGSCRLLTPLRV